MTCQMRVDILDHGQVRLPRSQLAPCPEGDQLEALDQEVFLTQFTQNNEISEKHMTPEERKQLDVSKLKDWDKLLKTEAIRVHVSDAAKELREVCPSERFLENRFVKTRRDDPNTPGKKELKCRWCIKGYLDPDLMELERQSPTLSMEGLSICLQIISSKKWRLIIADVEGAFLQGEPLRRKAGKLFAKIPKEGVPGQDPNNVVEVLKCVYGLSDAPRAWWVSSLRPFVA